MTSDIPTTRADFLAIADAAMAHVVAEYAAAEAASTIDIGDDVHHGPSGEDWVVARVDDRYLWPAGWPPTRADLADCKLIRKATEAQRSEMRARIGKLPEDDERRPAPVAEPKP